MSLITSSQSAQADALSSVQSSSVKQALVALVFGFAVLFIVGFMPVEAAHNAAHDARHALAFPCH